MAQASEIGGGEPTGKSQRALQLLYHIHAWEETWTSVNFVSETKRHARALQTTLKDMVKDGCPFISLKAV